MNDIFSYSDLTSIEEKSGCYCWYIDWSRIRKSDYENDVNRRVKLINSIFKVYSPNPIFINSHKQMFEKTQYFGETYSGLIKYDGFRTFNSDSIVCQNYDVFMSFINFVNSLIIPIYIGKSKNLNRRIKQHVDFLENVNITRLSSNEEGIESLKNFSERFSIILDENKTLGLKKNMLSVKIIYLDEALITDFEYNVNYIFKPLFGLK